MLSLPIPGGGSIILCKEPLSWADGRAGQGRAGQGKRNAGASANEIIMHKSMATASS